jgi:hypothetical protein
VCGTGIAKVYDTSPRTTLKVLCFHIFKANFDLGRCVIRCVITMFMTLRLMCHNFFPSTWDFLMTHSVRVLSVPVGIHFYLYYYGSQFLVCPSLGSWPPWWHRSSPNVSAEPSRHLFGGSHQPVEPQHVCVWGMTYTYPHITQAICQTLCEACVTLCDLTQDRKQRT